jgi:hypothetical protein
MSKMRLYMRICIYIDARCDYKQYAVVVNCFLSLKLAKPWTLRKL